MSKSDDEMNHETVVRYERAQEGIARMLAMNIIAPQMDAMKLVTIALHQVMEKVVHSLARAHGSSVSGYELTGILSKSLLDVGTIYLNKQEVH